MAKKKNTTRKKPTAKKPTAKSKKPKAKKPTAKSKKPKAKSKKPRAKSRRSKAAVTIATVKAAAFKCGCIVKGAEAIKIADMGKHFAKHPRHKAAWERGLFLGNLRDLAAAPTEKAEAAHELGMDPVAFEKLLADDSEAAAVWNQAHIDTVIEMKRQLRKQATGGKRYAIEMVLNAMRNDLVRPDVDFNRVQLADVSVVCGVTRQTVHSWVSRFGAPQNADGTYSLSAIWGWYEGFVAQKIEGGKVKVSAEASDPTRKLKADKLSLELGLMAGNLLNRDEVVAGILARHQQFLNAVSGKAEEMAMAMAGQPADVVVNALQEFFDGIKGDLCYVPDELRLDDAAAAIMQQLMEMIGGGERSEEVEKGGSGEADAAGAAGKEK